MQDPISFYMLSMQQEVQKEISLENLVSFIWKLPQKTIRIGYDVRLGFNIPDCFYLKEIISQVDKTFYLDVCCIDSREQSNKIPFRPCQIFFSVNGETRIHRIVNKRSVYVSQITLTEKTIKRIKEIYAPIFKKVDFIKEVIDNLVPGSSLGDFLFSLNKNAIQTQLPSDKGILVNYQYDKASLEKPKIHDDSIHDGHDFLFIAMASKKIRNQLLYLQSKYSRSKHDLKIIIPIESKPYFDFVRMLKV